MIAKFIAYRYFKAKAGSNIIHLITRVSVVGIAISVAALIVLLSAFNGIEQMVTQMYSKFDPPLSIRYKSSKSFPEKIIPIDQISQIAGVQQVSRAVEEVVILQRGKDKTAHAIMLGVDENFIDVIDLHNHLLDGTPSLFSSENNPQAIFGIQLLNRLDAYISNSLENKDFVTFHVPLRDGKLRPGMSPFTSSRILVGGAINYNREVNTGYVLLPFEKAREMLQYDKEITALFIDVAPKFNLQSVQQEVAAIVGGEFEVKTNLQKNELIFKTSQSEKLIVIFILVFIFLLSAINLIAAVIMLFVAKRQDLRTLDAMGLPRNKMTKIFFYQGLFINMQGLLIGIILGYTVVFMQLKFGLLQMPGAPQDFFPVEPTITDGFLIVALIALLGLLISYFPPKLLVNSLFKSSR
ncbi:MAG: ABC transporter permease [Crocinitomicaceae bacterium]|nr:ABC transporter permease [Crocinitomicaceae bacterium]